MKKSDPKWPSFETPRHPNCRSSLVPEVDGRYKYDDSDAQRPSKLTGKTQRVNSKKTYYQEMKKLTAAEQDEILGPTLGKAFRKLDNPDAFAKMTIDQRTLSPLTIAELKKKDSQLGKIIRNMK